MKIAIFTLPLRNYNYGGVLQNYALQTFLAKNFNCEVQTIDYNIYPSTEIKIKTFLQKVVYSGYWKFKNEVNKEFDTFFKNDLKLSPLMGSYQSVNQYLVKNKFDVLITGSDQVWRLDYAYGDIAKLMFLNFDGFKKPVKRVSYAASFGVDKWTYDNKTTEVKNALNAFDAISVREDSGLEICNKVFNVDAKNLIDPTLLLSKDEYVNQLKLNKKENTNFLYSYILDISEEKRLILDKIKAKLNVELATTILASEILYKVKPNNYKQFKGLKAESINEWVNSFYNSGHIITDSFHGMVFSIIFNKPFIVIGNKERGMSRFQSLLKKLNLEDRLFYDFDQNKMYNKLTEAIDYEYVNSIIKNEREVSKDFLNHIINKL
ncbi:polysaccharide pyruvyl transferase family protein [Empedobacter falsenii]